MIFSAWLWFRGLPSYFLVFWLSISTGTDELWFFPLLNLEFCFFITRLRLWLFITWLRLWFLITWLRLWFCQLVIDGFELNVMFSWWSFSTVLQGGIFCFPLFSATRLFLLVDLSVCSNTKRFEQSSESFLGLTFSLEWVSFLLVDKSFRFDWLWSYEY